MSIVQAGQEVDPFDGPVLGMVKMPADDLILVRVRFLYDGVVHNNDPIDSLDPAQTIKRHHSLDVIFGLDSIRVT